MPTLPSAVLAYNDRSRFHFTAELHLTWLVRWALRRTHPTPCQLSAVESWSEMSNEEDPSYPTLPSVISCWELKWHEQWGGPILSYPPISHQQLRVEVKWAMRRTQPILPSHQSSAVESWSEMSKEEDPPYPTPSAVESWSDMSNEEDPSYPTLPSVISNWELKWHEQWGGPNLSYPPISHQQLRVEVKWARRRTHPTQPPQQLRVEVTWAVRRAHPTYPPISHQQLRIEVTWAMRRTHSILPSHQSSAVQSWNDMSNEEDPPYPIPHWPYPHTFRYPLCLDAPIPLDTTHSFGCPIPLEVLICLDTPIC